MIEGGGPQNVRRIWSCARESFEQLEPRTAKRVLEFYGKRRSMRAAASHPLVPEVYAEQATLTG